MMKCNTNSIKYPMGQNYTLDNLSNSKIMIHNRKLKKLWDIEQVSNYNY